MIVVSNSSPIISLSSVGRIDLLEKLFSEIQIPAHVYSEIKAKNKYGHDEIDFPFFKVSEIKNKNSSLILESNTERLEDFNFTRQNFPQYLSASYFRISLSLASAFLQTEDSKSQNFLL